MSDEIDTASLQKKIKGESEDIMLPTCPNCAPKIAVLSEGKFFTLAKRIAALVKTCRDLIVRIEDAKGPKRLYLCSDIGSNFCFYAAERQDDHGNYEVVSKHSLLIQRIPYTEFEDYTVRWIREVKYIMTRIIETGKKAYKEVSSERYEIILGDIIDRLSTIKDILSYTHEISTIDIEHLNSKLDELVMPYSAILHRRDIISFPHVKILADYKYTCSYVGERVCTALASIYCKLCKKYYCRNHIRHAGEKCYLDNCKEDCGCSDPEDE